MVSISSNSVSLAFAVSGINANFLTDGKCKGQGAGTISEGIFGLAASSATA
jgi:hypothetical protein